MQDLANRIAGTPYSTLLFLLFLVIPISIAINPELVPRFLGETSHISQHGYLDLEHYIAIARNFDLEAWRTAFYPVWPSLLRFANNLSTIGIYKTAIFLSALIGVISLVISKSIFYRITENTLSGFISWSLYVISPMTVFFFCGYTESLFALESWLVIIAAINILTLGKSNRRLYFINAFILVTSSIFLALTRPTLVQNIFSVIGTMLILSNLKKGRVSLSYNRCIKVSILILASSIIGYIIYGSSLIAEGFRFFEPFHAQSDWNKSLGFRPIFLLTSKSPIIDLWGLYYPLILIASSTSGLKLFNIELGFIQRVFFKKLPLTLLYPPLGIVYGLASNLVNPKGKNNHVLLKESPNKLSTFRELEFIFWYSALFAFSHSIITFLTQPEYMNSLGRYVFGQPYFYIAMSFVIAKIGEQNIRKIGPFFIAIFGISTLYLLKNFIDFGNARLLT